MRRCSRNSTSSFVVITTVITCSSLQPAQDSERCLVLMCHYNAEKSTTEISNIESILNWHWFHCSLLPFSSVLSHYALRNNVLLIELAGFARNSQMSRPRTKTCEYQRPIYGWAERYHFADFPPFLYIHWFSPFNDLHVLITPCY